MSVVYRLLRDDLRFGLRAGDLLACESSQWDPEKVNVIRRLADGFDPKCSQYRAAVERVLPAIGAGR